MDVYLQDEHGAELERVLDDTNVIQQMILRAADEGFQYLCDIDWYGNTVFNVIQSRKVLREWSKLSGRLETAEERRVFEQVRAVLEQVCEQHHLYIKFEGD